MMVTKNKNPAVSYLLTMLEYKLSILVKPCPSIEGSRRFLRSYLNSLLMIKQCPEMDVAKGEK
jgi:hypothetical protein